MTSDLAVDRCSESSSRRSATKSLLSATLLALGLAGCGGGDDSEPVPIEFAIVDEGSNSALNQSAEFLSRTARTDSEWQAMWVSNYIGTRPPPAPAVDFGRLMVIGAFLGGRPSICYAIAVREVQLSPQEVEVVYTERTPNGAGCPPGGSSPYQFVSIPTTSLPVRFRKI